MGESVLRWLGRTTRATPACGQATCAGPDHSGTRRARRRPCLRPRPRSILSEKDISSGGPTSPRSGSGQTRSAPCRAPLQSAVVRVSRGVVVLQSRVANPEGVRVGVGAVQTHVQEASGQHVDCLLVERGPNCGVTGVELALPGAVVRRVDTGDSSSLVRTTTHISHTTQNKRSDQQRPHSSIDRSIAYFFPSSVPQ